MPATSPHTRATLSTGQVMSYVLLGLVPGVVALTWFYGAGTLVNLVWLGLLAMAMEALIVRLRGRSVGFYLSDGSALVTAALLAVAIPPYTPWWTSLIGIASAIVMAKHLYGGLGFNPFNPAMVGYVVVLISFPVQMTQWATPAPLLEDGITVPGLLDSVALIFGGQREMVDGITSATALDQFKHNRGLLVEDFVAATPLFSAARWNAVGVEWVNIGFLAGGLFLLSRRLFTWHAPVGMLACMALLSLLFWDGGSSTSKGGILFHLLGGATMLGAFFIVTDPVSGATSKLGRFLFGVGVGILVFLIRSWGSYPDGVAFAVLLMNFAAPFIDYYTQPRTYGHERRPRVRVSGE